MGQKSLCMRGEVTEDHRPTPQILISGQTNNSTAQIVKQNPKFKQSLRFLAPENILSTKMRGTRHIQRSVPEIYRH